MRSISEALMSGSSETPAWSVVLSQREKEGFAFVHESIDSEAQLITLLAAARQSNTSVIRGLPGRVPPESPVSAAVYADLSAMKSVIEHEVADQVINVETGITIAELNSYLARHHQWWPVYAPDNWTVADALEHGAGGPLEHRYGGPRELVLGTRIVLADGSAINCGGRVVKNVTGYDLGKVFIGSHGWLGISIRAFLRLYALPPMAKTLIWNFGDAHDDMFAAADILNRSGLPLSCLEMAGGKALSALQAGSSSKLNGLTGSVLIGQIYGLADVVFEVAASARTLVSGVLTNAASPEVVELEPDEQDVLWNYLRNTYGEVSNAVGVAAISFSTLRQMVRDCSVGVDSGATSDVFRTSSWTFRPATGRLACLTDDSQSALTCGRAVHHASSLTAALGKFSEQSSKPVTIALADSHHNFHVHSLPQQDLTLAELQHRMKLQFDPARILNPFVHL
jgi:FAD/FMN-containing dehydrogenase